VNFTGDITEKCLLKVIITSHCSNNCFYCPFSRKRDFRRKIVKPDELSEYFLNVYNRGFAKGIFISSGILGKWYKSQKLINETVYLLRKKFDYRGYIHTKVMPGADYNAIEEAIMFSDRVSINLEAPSEKRLKQISPEKNFGKELLSALYKIREMRFHLKDKFGKRILKSGVSTQFVVGARGERDYEYLKVSYYLLKSKLVDTVYFSAFRPVRGTKFENLRPVSKLREKRLYQAFKLLKYYGFSLKDVYFDENLNLPLNKDPKEVWAERNKEFFPIDIKKADFEELIRVPGIGPKRAKKILELRKEFSVDFPEKILEIIPGKSFRYLVFKGKRILNIMI